MNKTESNVYSVAVIGGGAAGMFSAVTAAARTSGVVLLEQNRRLGWKLSITGKGRCNLTNNTTPQEMLKQVNRNPKFLYSALSAFSPQDTMSFFTKMGVPLKTERGGRVFPVSDRAGDVVDALKKALERAGVEILCTRARELLLDGSGRICGVQTEGGAVYAKTVILASGGKSYAATGSRGDGYKMAERAGHSITVLEGALVPLCTEEQTDTLAGLRLKNVAIRLMGSGKKPVYTDFGEIEFLKSGLGGPMAISASCHVEDGRTYRLSLDLKPALSREQLDARVLREFSARGGEFRNTLRSLVPAQMTGYILRESGLDGGRRVAEVTRTERERLIDVIKDLRFTITGKHPVDEAIITRGGIPVREVQPATMESRIVPGLYFAGEILDLDAYTGGYNLQIAWTTAFAAGTASGQAAENML